MAGPKHLEALRRAIQAGADPNTPDEDGRTPLHHAIAAKDEALVALLLERGADYEAKDHRGDPPTSVMYDEDREPYGVSFRLKRGFRRILELIHQRVMAGYGTLTFLNREDLYNAICDDNLLAVEEALGEGGVWDLDIHLADGTSPLHLAAQRGNPAIVEALLRHDEGVYFPDGTLRRFPRARRDARDHAGKTALDYARELGHHDVVALLEADEP